MTISCRCLVVLGVVLGLGAKTARADELWLRAGAKVTGVRVVNIKGSDVQFRHRGEIRVKAIRDVQGIVLDGVEGLKEAEQFMRQSQFGRAAKQFERVRAKLSREWQRQWVDLRWAQALSQTNQFEAAVRQYLSVVERFPKKSREAKPTPRGDISAKTASRLLLMIGEAIERASSSTSNKETIRKETIKKDLLSLRLSVLEHTSNLDEVVALLKKQPGTSGGRLAQDVSALLVSPGQGDKETLIQCRLAIKRRDWDLAKTRALEVMNSARGEALAEAYYLYGLIAVNQAEGTKGRVRGGWWFMRVVAHYPESGWAAKALYEASKVEKKCGRRQTALSLLQECKKMPSLPDGLAGDVDAAIKQIKTSG